MGCWWRLCAVLLNCMSTLKPYPEHPLYWRCSMSFSKQKQCHILRVNKWKTKIQFGIWSLFIWQIKISQTKRYSGNFSQNLRYRYQKNRGFLTMSFTQPAHVWNITGCLARNVPTELVPDQISLPNESSWKSENVPLFVKENKFY